MELTKNEIENRIFEFKSVQVMIDRDLAEMYQVETKVLNQAVKRNIERFPDYFRFQLTNAEKEELVTNCDRFENNFEGLLNNDGKKWFAFSKMNHLTQTVLKQLAE